MVTRALTCILPFRLLACRPAVPADPYALETSPSPVFISEYRVLDGWLELCNPADTTVSLGGYRLIVDGDGFVMMEVETKIGKRCLLNVYTDEQKTCVLLVARRIQPIPNCKKNVCVTIHCIKFYKSYGMVIKPLFIVFIEIKQYLIIIRFFFI